MACDLIRVDFKNGIIKSRTELKEAEYDPTKCPSFNQFIEHMKEQAIDAFKAGVDPKRMVMVLADPLNNFVRVIYDPVQHDMISTANHLDFAYSRLTYLINEEAE